MALMSACLLYSRETTCKWNSCAISTIKDAKKIARIIRLLDWLNTGIDQKKRKIHSKKFLSKLQCKNFSTLFKKVLWRLFTQYLFCTASFLGIKAPLQGWAKGLPLLWQQVWWERSTGFQRIAIPGKAYNHDEKWLVSEHISHKVSTPVCGVRALYS